MRRLVVVLGIAACADEPAGGGPCDAPGEVLRLDESPCADWTDVVRGRVVKNTFGSAVIWSRRTDDGYGILASATHVLGLGWFGPEGEDVAAGFVEPETQGVLRLNVPPADGGLELATYSPLYSLFHLEIPADENDDGLRGIRPAHDAFLGLVDMQRIEYSGDGPFPSYDDRTPGLVALHDPEDLSRTAPMWSTPGAGDVVVLVGYPQDSATFPLGAMAVGRVLSDDDARAAIEDLAAAGDEEGTIAYDPAVEILVEGSAQPGMSGGGAFDAGGRWVGTLVRASTEPDAPRIVRIVRASYLAARATETYDALAAAEQAALAPFLDPALTP